MSRFTPLARLPGHFVSFFDGENVVCSWKGHPGYTLLCFFEAPGPNAKTTQCRNLLFLEFEGVVAGPEEAYALAVRAWAKYRQRILAGDGERVSAAEKNENESDDCISPAGAGTLFPQSVKAANLHGVTDFGGRGGKEIQEGGEEK